MISRGVSGTHICWRCQLRLSKSAPTNSTFPPHVRRPQEVRLQHNDALSESVASSSTPAQKPEGSKNNHDEGIRRVSTELTTPPRNKGNRAWRPLQKKAVTEYPLGRLHGFRGHRLREKRAELSIDSLGKPAEVIVLRDTGFHSNPRPEIEELKAPEKVDILTQLDAERGLITQADVEKNIEEFKPKTKTISWEDLQQIQRQLVTGFTTSQLIKYSNAFGRWQNREEVEEHEVSTRKASVGAIMRKTEWVPGISETGDEFDESALRGYGSEAFTPKQRLVLLLLRQCWQVEVQEVIESIGEVELEIRGTELELLIEGQNPPLKVISDKLIASQEEKIEAFRSRSVVRITAAKEKSEVIIQEIQDMLQGVRSLTIDLNALDSELKGQEVSSRSDAAIDDSVINELAQLTETHITRLPNNQLELAISCIDAKPKANLSTKADVARRLLLTSSNASNRTKTLQGCKNISQPLIAVKYHMTDGMSWRDRLRHWVRWTSAISKSPETLEEPDNRPPQQAREVSGTSNKFEIEESFPITSAGLPVSVGLSQEEINQTKLHRNWKKPSGYIYWDRKTFTATSAIVGHLLHGVPSAPEVATKSAEDAATQRSIFRSATVNISRLFGTMTLLNNLPTTSLVLRFTPSPWTAAGPGILTSLPPVEMRFAVDTKTKELHLKDVIAVVESTGSDVMLPDRILDLRFQQRTTARLRTLHHHQLAQISEFLKTSQLNLMRGRLETPPGLTLPIASHLCNAQVSEAPQNSVDESINAEYIFGGLEYRSRLALDFKGWQLLYTSVEGGKADGRRGELSLRPRRVTDDISEIKKSSAAWTDEFIEAAYLLVDTLEKYGTVPGRFVNSSSLAHDTKELSGLSYKSVLERNKAFRYFRQRINFMKYATENEGADELAEKHASPGLEDAAEGREDSGEELSGSR